VVTEENRIKEASEGKTRATTDTWWKG